MPSLTDERGKEKEGEESMFLRHRKEGERWGDLVRKGKKRGNLACGDAERRGFPLPVGRKRRWRKETGDFSGRGREG